MNFLLQLALASAQYTDATGHGKKHSDADYSHAHVHDVYVAPSYETADPIYSCSKPYTKIGKECVKSSKAEPTAACEHGAKLNKDSMCESKMLEKAMRGCPSGYELSKGDKCVSIESIPQQLYCKEGTLDNGVCVNDKTPSPKLFCPKSTKLEGGLCISTLKTQAVEVCEDDFVLTKGGKCVKYEYSTPVRICPENFSPLGDECVKYSAPDVECPKGFAYNRSNDNCVQTVKSNPSYACPDGYAPKGKKCYATEEYPAEPVCKQGYMYNHETDKCYTVVEEKPMGKCEEGDHFEKGWCSAKKEEEAVAFCLNGVIDSKGHCVDFIVEPSMIGCPKGKELGADGMCAVFSVQNISCDYGYLDETEEYCSAELSVKSELECVYGELKGDYCYSSSGEQPILMCPEGSVQFGDECLYPASSPSVKCPKHYKATSNSECARTVTMDSSPYCRPGLTLKGNTCEKFTEFVPQYYCKSGHLIDNVCLDAHSAKPKPNCPKGYKLDKSGLICKRPVKLEKEIKKPVKVTKKSNSVEDMHGKKKSEGKKTTKEEELKLKMVKMKEPKSKESHYKKAPEPKKKESEPKKSGHHGH